MALRALIWTAVSTAPQANEDVKVSLPLQEADARALCTREGWSVIDVLKVPGHSRHYIDIHECAADMRAQGINAFDRLLHLWDVRGFDVLIVRDGDRFARTQTLHAYVTERTIQIGARIFSLQDGWVDQNNFRMWIAMGGYRAASDIDRLVKARSNAMDNRAARGLPTSAWVLFPYTLLRDDKGNALRLVLDESKRRLWDDLATLLLEGVGWHDIERELYQRFGHVSPKGVPFRATYFYNLVHNPGFWGHSARHFNDRGSPNGAKTDLWVFDPSEQPPDGVTIYYNTHEPVYTGDLAERVKAELRRRRMAIRGSARPHRTYMFSGLLICAECGYNLVVTHKKTYTGYYCPSKDPANRRNPARPVCGQRRQINENSVQEYVDRLLRAMLDTMDINSLLEMPSTVTGDQVIGALKTEIAGLDTQIRRMIRQHAQTAEDDPLRHIYEEEIDSASNRLKILRADLVRRQQHTAATEVAAQSRLAALEDLKAQSIDSFWKLPATQINQLLHRLFGKRRLVVKEADIVGVADAPVRPKRPPRARE